MKQTHEYTWESKIGTALFVSLPESSKKGRSINTSTSVFSGFECSYMLFRETDAHKYRVTYAESHTDSGADDRLHGVGNTTQIGFPNFNLEGGGELIKKNLLVCLSVLGVTH